jgi:hypothetical protein
MPCEWSAVNVAELQNVYSVYESIWPLQLPRIIKCVCVWNNGGVGKDLRVPWHLVYSASTSSAGVRDSIRGMLGKTALRKLRREKIVLHVCQRFWSPPLQSLKTHTCFFFLHNVCAQCLGSLLLMKRQFVVTHTIRQTEIPALLDSWVTNLLPWCVHKTIACPWCFHKTEHA